MSDEKIASLVGLAVAFAVLAASYLQWWRITYDGKFVLRPWVKVLFVMCMGGCVFAAMLILSVPALPALGASISAVFAVIALICRRFCDMRLQKP